MFSGASVTDKGFNFALMLALALAGAICYANTLNGEFVWDDASSILLHQHVQDPSKFFQLFQEDQHAFGRGQGNFYRPLVSVSFMVDYLLTYSPASDAPAPGASYPDIKPFVFHISNALWHILAAIFFYLLLIRLGVPPGIRAVASLLYVVHPLHTEAVTYISGRADMMSAAFMFLGLWAALAQGPARRRIVGALFAAICFAAGLLSKESSFIFPFLLLLLLVLRPIGTASKKPELAWRALPLILALAVGGAYAALRMTVLRFSEAQDTGASPLLQRLVETLQAFAFYIVKLFVPLGLHMEQTLAGYSGWWAALGALLLAALLGAFVLAIRMRQHRIAMAFGWFVITWVPISGIFPLNAPMAEHWMYVPMAGFWWGMAELVALAAQSPAARRAACAAAALMFIVFAGLTANRNEDWTSNESIFLATLRENPDSARVQFNLAVTYDDLIDNKPAAERHYEAALRLYERSGQRSQAAEVHFALAELLAAQQRYADASDHYGQALSLNQPNGDKEMAVAIALGLGKSLIAQGNPAAADQVLRQALTMNPAVAPIVSDLLTGAPF
ncbi:MAG: tetratricopeptide repeat protein [Candidatus Hydrogenedentes bacterium]|nr:tetratricopeptide repeat protein [Candidatus Hydrogenedentota bacterium]